MRVNNFDLGEFMRFVLTGLTSTAGNLAAVWISVKYSSYNEALIVGIVVASTISFVMSKLFAFRAHGWRQAAGEAARFLVVYSVGALIYWVVSLTAGTLLLPRLMPKAWAEMGGVLVGAGVMTFTSYFGHRFYTYGNAVAAGAR